MNRIDLYRKTIFFSFLIAILVSSPALAHKVNIFAWVEGDKVMCDAYFSKSRKVQGGKIQVLDPAGKVLLEGVTSDEGMFSFAPPQKSDLKIVLEAGMGHKAYWIVKADELGGTTAPEQTAAAEPPKAVEPKEEAKSVSASIDADTMKKIVTEAVATELAKELPARMAPLERAIAELKMQDDDPDYRDIIGGLGWIVGIMGLFLYFKSRK